MSEPKHVKNWLYPVMKEIFMKFLVNKHNKPYKDIAISEMTESNAHLFVAEKLSLTLHCQ